MVLCPDVPIVDDGAGQQNADAACQSCQYCEPPRPTVNALHRGVEAHGPAPEQSGAFGCCAAINDLFNLTLAAETADGQDGCAVHGEQQSGAVQEGDAEGVEWVIEQVAVGDGEQVRPIKVAKDAIRHGRVCAFFVDRRRAGLCLRTPWRCANC